MRVLSEILDSTPIGYNLSFHIVYRIDKVSVCGTKKITKNKNWLFVQLKLQILIFELSLSDNKRYHSRFVLIFL